LKKEKPKKKQKTITGIIVVGAGFVICFAGVFCAAAARAVTGVGMGLIVVGILVLLTGFMMSIVALRSGPLVSIEGRILDYATNHHLRGTTEVNQDFYLVEDNGTQQKYPVYVDRKLTFSTLSLRPRKFLHEKFEIGDSVTVTGRMNLTICKSGAGKKILSESDMDSTDTGMVGWAEFLVPQTMDRILAHHSQQRRGL